MIKIGIIKGGQLGKMLIEAASGYGLFIRVMDPSMDAPCRILCDEFVQADPGDYESVYQFGKSCDILTFEYEHVNIEALAKLESEGVRVFPRPHTLKIIQDKGLQKNFYLENNIPTADFVFIQTDQDLQRHPQYFPGVLKLRKHGYDGKGVLKIDSANDSHNRVHGPSILEKKIDFEKEISMIVARNVTGDLKLYPVVEMVAHPDKNLLDILFSPAAISEKLKKDAENIATKIAEKLELVGVLAVEMFVTKDNRVLVNEIAPRPHNSGHHTIEANITSQYQQHLRAVLGLPLGQTDARAAAAMVNLVGADGYSGIPKFVGTEHILEEQGYYLHVYDKKETKPFRKMGHITVLDQNVHRAREKAKWIKEKVKVIT